MSAVVAIERVTKRYGAVIAVENVQLDLQSGETLALVGHNGAGKTTLVKLILGLIVPTAGQVRVLDRNPAAAEGAGVRAGIGFLAENVAFHGAMTGRELMGFYSRLKGASGDDIDDLLDRVGLVDAAGRRVGTYSKGMRQRLGLAQALIGEPELLLLDEPTSGLDPASRGDFYRMIDELRREGVTVLISTHALAEIEAHADRIAVMHGGKLIALGTVDELRSEAAMPVRIRFTVAPCSTGRLLDRLGEAVEVFSRSDRELEIGCPPEAKMALLRNLQEGWREVEDVVIEMPGLPELYRGLVEREDGK